MSRPDISAWANLARAKFEPLILHPSALALLLIFAFALFFSVLSIQQHRAFLTHGLDLGNVDQALWNTAQGRLLHFTLMAPLQSRLALHVEPILFFFMPFYWLDLGSPELLLGVQAIVVALGAWPVYQLSIINYELIIKTLATQAHYQSRRQGGAKTGEMPRILYYVALAIPAAYLLLPALESAVLFDFHVVTLAPTFLLFAFLALEQGQERRFFCFTLLAMACKEDVPLTTALLGLYAGLSRQRWRLAGLTISLSLAWFITAFWVIQPRFAAGGNIQLDRYAWLGQNPLEMLQTLIGQPGRVLEHLWYQADILGYLSRLFFPTAYLALFNPLTLLLLLPALAVNLLSDNPFTWRLEDFHYGAPLAPFLLISAIYGIRRISQWAATRTRNLAQAGESVQAAAPAPRLIALLTLLLFTFSAIYHYHRGYTPLARSFRWPDVIGHEQRLNRLLSTVPAETALFTQPNLAPHLSHRTTIYNDFAYFTDPEFRAKAVPVEDIVLDVTAFENIGGLHQFLRRTLLESGDYKLVSAQDGILHLQPAPGSSAGNALVLPSSFYTFTQANGRLEYALRVDFGQVMRLHGYTLHFDRQEEIEVTVDLELLQPSERLKPVLYLLDDQGRPVGATIDLQPGQVWFPVARWSVGEIVRFRFNTLPWYTRQTLTYRLALGVIEGDDVWDVGRRQRPVIGEAGPFALRFSADGSLIELARIEQRWDIPQGGPTLRQFSAPVPAYTRQASFGGQLQLLGYSTPLLARSGQQAENLSVTLYWRAVEAPEPLIRFVQLIGPDRLIYGQQDGVPDFGLYPTEQWQPGEVVVDRVTLPLQPERPGGSYTLHIGLYRPDRGERLQVSSGGDHVEIAIR